MCMSMKQEFALPSSLMWLSYLWRKTRVAMECLLGLLPVEEMPKQRLFPGGADNHHYHLVFHCMAKMAVVRLSSSFKDNINQFHIFIHLICIFGLLSYYYLNSI